MSRLAASGIATALALAMVAGSAISQPQARAEPTRAPMASQSDQATIGQCRILYDGLAAERQPAFMECEHANWIARSWGGRVMWQTAQGQVQLAEYAGRNDFTGVPSAEVPRRGYCRAWIDGAPVSQQPAENDCVVARREAAERGGRVLYMPL